ncbi:hypothetical protein KVT40_000499 [Elsinoe batatas]|uniref:Uncharacterized protein n=1 Tax=Elsinoe batatas TaxID=2601811 RepID=A0A8K0LA78_9PEZI|nr:hypothetical protein KVT40_000499 [Elsinoe batatas]
MQRPSGGPCVTSKTLLVAVSRSLRTHLLGETRSMSTLPKEVLLTILKHVNPAREVRHDERAFLSRDSLADDRWSQPDSEPVRDLGNFRLSCGWHASVGAEELFRAFTVRFTIASLERLAALARRTDLASHVRKLVYKVPFFYQAGRRGIAALEEDPDIDPCRVQKWQDRFIEQHRIIGSGQDRRALIAATRAFRNLQQVLILQVLLEEDHDAFRLFRSQHDATEEYFDLSWGPACSRATDTFISALQAAESNFMHLSSYFFSTQAAYSLTRRGLGQLRYDPNTLTRLILTFYEMDGLDDRIRQLAPHLKQMLKSLECLENLHFGFYYPLDLPFYTVFPQHKWKNMLVFGVEGWRLTTNEIKSFTCRHRRTLRGLRLRHVLLKDDSYWKDVLFHLRTTMMRLKWISLGRIGYASDFDHMEAQMGVEITEEMLAYYNSDDDDDDDSAPWHDNDNIPVQVDTQEQATDWDANSDLDPNEIRLNPFEHDPDAHENEFPPIPSPPSSVSSSTSSDEDMDSLDVLRDEGDGPISGAKRKMWESWVLRRGMPH